MKASAWRTALFWAVLAVAACVHWYALWSPLVLDDFEQRAMIEGRLVPARNALDLYDFVSDGTRSALMDRGALPWWSDAGLKTRFLRPLPSLFVWLDYRLSGYGAVWPHVCSLLWWAAAVAGAYALFVGSLGGRAAALGALVFAVSPAHTVPVWWLANRYVLISVAVGSVALASHARWRELGGRGAGVRTALLWALTMTTGEYALCFAGYVVAIELLNRREPALRRLVGISAWLVPTALYALLYIILGYGVRGSGFYRSPLTDPASYVAAIPRAVQSS